MILKDGIEYFDNLQNSFYNVNTNLKLKECKIECDFDIEQHSFETSNNHVCIIILIYFIPETCF
jgi:hypothetical protein